MPVVTNYVAYTATMPNVLLPFTGSCYGGLRTFQVTANGPSANGNQIFLTSEASGMAALLSGGTVSWTGMIPENGSVTIQFQVQIGTLATIGIQYSITSTVGGITVTPIWKLPLAGGEPTLVSAQNGKDATVSGDGRYLYFTVHGELWRRDLATGREGPLPELIGREIGRAWHLGSRALYFVHHSPDANPIVFRLDLRRRKIEPLVKLDGPISHWVPGISVSPTEDLLTSSYLRYRLGDIMLLTGW